MQHDFLFELKSHKLFPQQPSLSLFFFFPLPLKKNAACRVTARTQITQIPEDLLQGGKHEGTASPPQDRPCSLKSSVPTFVPFF